MRRIKHLTFIEQMEKQECGMACLSMLLKYHNYNITLLELRNKYGVPKDGLSFQNMLDICREYNIDACAYRVEKENVLKLQKPCIIQWNNNTHFVLIYKIGKKYVRIMDPAVGELKISIEEFLIRYNMNVFMLETEGNTKDTIKKTSIYNKATKAIRTNIELFICLLVASTAIIIVGLVPTYILGKLIDTLLSNRVIEYHQVYLVIAIPIIMLFLNYMKYQISVALNNRIEWDLMSNYLKNFFKASLKFFENRNRGDLIGRFDMITQLSDFYTTELVSLLLNIIMVLFYLYILFSYSIILGSVVLLWNLISILVIVLLISESYNLSKMTLMYRIEMKNLLAEDVNLANSIKTHSLEHRQYNNWENLFKKIVNMKKRSGRLRGGLTALLTAWQIAQTFIVFFSGSKYVINNTMSFGTLYFVMMISGMISEPLISACSVGLDYIDISTLIQRIDDTENARVDSPLRIEDNYRYKLRGKITFSNVSFSYSKFEQEILKDVSFEIAENEVVMLKGASGVGKSTIVKLLLGIQKPVNGQILIDSIPIKDYDLKTLRKSIAVISQEDTLFNTTIKDNIVLDERVDKEKLYSVMENTGVLSLISSLPKGENTVVYENGSGLSHGQIQRILLARALYKNASIIILDEATNSLDEESSNYILTKLEKLKCTKILISHHNNNLKVNKILRIENGMIIEQIEDKEC